VDISTILFTQLTSGAACAYILQLLQQWKALPWITAHTTKINILVRLAMSAGAALGIGLTWAPAAGSGHALTIAIPSGVTLLHGIWHWFGQYALQHGWLKVFQIQSSPASATVVAAAPAVKE
jgi:hypothetical protein